MDIVGRGFSPAELESYLRTLPTPGWSPRFIVVHNTDEPDLKLYSEWLTRSSWTGEQWLRNLKLYYEGKGWSGGPHLFVAPDKIWAFNPLWRAGVHTPSWNRISVGVETVGNFDREPFEGGVRTNLVAALALLHRHFELDPADYKLGVRGLHYHKEDHATTHRDCPGKNMDKVELVHDVVEEMGAAEQTHVTPSVAAQDADTSPLPPEADGTRWVQEALNKVLGTTLKVDGSVGPATRAAVRAFQRQQKILVDGVAGPLTRLALHRQVGAAPSGTGL